MANLETKQLDDVIASRRAMMFGGTALAALALAGTGIAKAQAAAVTDADILNFALNLEYLEANFYYLAAFGYTIDKAPSPININGGSGTGVAVTTKPNFTKVPFANSAVQSYAIETAYEEGKHVSFLSGALGSAAVAQPAIDLFTSFNTLASAAGIGPSFDPFSSDAFFLVGAYIFEDVGVSAYSGAAPLISTAGIAAGYLAAAAGILAVEAYHAGLVRTTINSLDPNNAAGYLTITQQISALRSKLSLAANTAVTVSDDVPLGGQTVTLGASAGQPALTLVDADANAIAFARNTTQVLNIVTGGASTSSPYQGVFFPQGLNGTIK